MALATTRAGATAADCVRANIFFRFCVGWCFEVFSARARRDGEGGGQPAGLAHGERGGGGTRSRSFRSCFEARGRPERGGGAGARASQPRRCRQVEDPRRVHLTITRVGPHMERRALPRGGARRRRAGNALRKPFAFGRVPSDGKGAGMTSRTRARGFSLHGWRCFGASRRFDWPAVDLGLARDFFRIHACTSTSRTQEVRITKRRVSAPSVSR